MPRKQTVWLMRWRYADQRGPNLRLSLADYRALLEFCLVVSQSLSVMLKARREEGFGKTGARYGRYVCIEFKGSIPTVLVVVGEVVTGQ